MDFNNDGRKDLVVGENYGCLRLYSNVGTDAAPVFNGYSLIQVGGGDYYVPAGFSMPVIVDWNNDGRKDIVVGDGNGDIYLLLNTGTDAVPVFAAAALIPNTSVGAGGRASPVVVDWNGDGKKDLLVGETYGKVLYFENKGTDASPSFSGSQALKAGGTTLNVGYYARPTVADWDSDGLLDLLVGNDAGQVLYYHARMSPPTVSAMATDNQASEPGTNTGSFRISRTGATDASMTVNFAMGGTATRGTDYNLTVGGELLAGDSVDIPALESFVDVILEPITDNTVEPAQQAVLTLRPGTGYAVKTPGTATVTITDNIPIVSLSATDATAGETLPGALANPGLFRITRTQLDVSQPLVVTFNLTGSTATSGSDYAAFPLSVTIPAGLKLATIPVTVLDDDLVEGKENVVMNLAADSAYAIAPTGRTAAVLILDNEPTVAVKASDAKAAETAPGQKPNPGGFTISRNGGDKSKPLTIQCDYNLSTATAGADYDALPPFVTIPAGAASVTLTVNAIDDATAEPTETVVLTLVSAAGSLCSAAVQIADNEPIVSVKASLAQAAETLPGQKSKPGAFTVTRAGGDINQPLLVKYNLSGSAATDGSDYEALTGEVTIPAGAKSASIPVTVIDDDEGEGCETVVLTLSADAKYNVNPKQQAGTVKIADNEPIVAIAASDARAAEVPPGKPLDLGAFTVTRTGGDLSQPLLVKYGLTGTADGDIDYEALADEVTIPAGAKSAKFFVTPKADGVAEEPETIILTLLTDRKYVIVPKKGAATVTLTDRIA